MPSPALSSVILLKRVNGGLIGRKAIIVCAVKDIFHKRKIRAYVFSCNQKGGAVSSLSRTDTLTLRPYREFSILFQVKKGEDSNRKNTFQSFEDMWGVQRSPIATKGVSLIL